jgi:hypothetical protein
LRQHLVLYTVSVVPEVGLPDVSDHKPVVAVWGLEVMPVEDPDGKHGRGVYVVSIFPLYYADQHSGTAHSVVPLTPGSFFEVAGL